MEAIAALYRSPASDSDAEISSDDGCTGVASADMKRQRSGSRTDEEEEERQRKRQCQDNDKPRWKRAFDHVEGNWPSHVRVDVTVADEASETINRVVSRARCFVGGTTTLVPLTDEEELHLSLSRPFVLTYDQIEAFVDILRSALKWRTRFSVELDNVVVLVNDESTRSFLALQVGSGAPLYISLLKCVDKCMREFALPVYYSNPIPHLSVASALGDSLQVALTSAQLDQLREELEATPVVVPIAAVQVSIGNKQFRIPLR